MGQIRRERHIWRFIKEMCFWLFCMNNIGYWCINKIIWQQIFVFLILLHFWFICMDKTGGHMTTWTTWLRNILYFHSDHLSLSTVEVVLQKTPAWYNSKISICLVKSSPLQDEERTTWITGVSVPNSKHVNLFRRIWTILTQGNNLLCRPS